MGRLPKKGVLGLFANLRWDLPRKRGGLRPQCTLWKYGNILKNTVALVMGLPLFLKRFRM